MAVFFYVLSIKVIIDVFKNPMPGFKQAMLMQEEHKYFLVIGINHYFLKKERCFLYMGVTKD
jgi:hypothetical protein